MKSLPQCLFHILILAAGSSIANGQDDNSVEAPSQSEVTEPSKERTKESTRPGKVAPVKTKTPPKEENESNKAAEAEADEVQKPLPEAPAPAPAPPSMLSKKIGDRLYLGTSVGLASIKPAKGSWQGPGQSSVFGAWRKSRDPSGKLFITARYTPYAGILKTDNRYYNMTMHGLFGGASFLLPIAIGDASWKAGLELGYLMVYASPQDGGEVESKVRAGKFAAAFSTELTWKMLEKVHVGPFLSVAAGGLQIIQGGVSASFQF